MLFASNPINLASARVPPKERWPPKAFLITHFGQKLIFHSVSDGGRHLSGEDLEPYRQLGDERVDQIYHLFEQEGRKIKATDDLLEMAEHANKPSSPAEHKLQEFVQHYSVLPGWVDVRQLRRGQDVFLAYLPAISGSLYYRSLVPGFSIPKIAAVLQATGYLAPPSTREAVSERLMDTGALIAATMCDLESLLPGGKGWRTVLHVRFLHSKVRRLLLRQSKWDRVALGVPINQEDMTATLLAFSTNSLLGCELVLGFPLPAQDRKDYVALWRYIGWLLGVDVDEPGVHHHSLKPLDPCGPGWISSNPDQLEHSYAIFQSIIIHILKPDDLSKRISHHLLRIGRNTNESDTKNQDNWFFFRSMRCRAYIGNELADALDLPTHPKWYCRVRHFIMIQATFLFLKCYTILCLPWSPFRNVIMRFHKKRLDQFYCEWQAAHHSRMKAKFKTDRVCPFAMLTRTKFD